MTDYSQRIYKMDLADLDYGIDDSLAAPQIINAEEMCEWIWKPDVNMGSCMLNGIDETGNVLKIRAIDLTSDTWINLLYNVNSGEYEEIFTDESELFYELQALDNSWAITRLENDEETESLGYEYLDYAFENRERMLEKVCDVVKAHIERYAGLTVSFTDKINCHHNYAALENHYDANVWVHRKGATRVRLGERAVIPGAMGSYSYVVEGKGNAESFYTSSHGAGRAYSRTGAMNAFTTEQVMVDLKEQGVILGKRKKNDVAEECRFAYKDIDEVMAQQTNIVTPIRKLKTVGVVKG